MTHLLIYLFIFLFASLKHVFISTLNKVKKIATHKLRV